MQTKTYPTKPYQNQGIPALAGGWTRLSPEVSFNPINFVILGFHCTLHFNRQNERTATSVDELADAA